MAQESSYNCIDASGNSVGPFLNIEKLKGPERISLTVASPDVVEAAEVCLGCPSHATCNDDDDLWVIGKPMNGWYAFTKADLPIVHGARLLYKDEHKMRHADAVPVTVRRTEEVESKIDAFDVEIASEVTDALIGGIGISDLPRRIGEGVLAILAGSEVLAGSRYAEIAKLALEAGLEELETRLFTQVDVCAPTVDSSEPDDCEDEADELAMDTEETITPDDDVDNVLEKEELGTLKPEDIAGDDTINEKETLIPNGTDYAPAPIIKAPVKRQKHGAGPGRKPIIAAEDKPERNRGARRNDDDPNDDIVRMYLADIGKTELLTKDDETRLAKAIEAGNEALVEIDNSTEISPSRKLELRRLIKEGEDAKRQFIQSNLRLVVSIAKKYQNSGMPLLDLAQEGNLGLIRAVEKFDWRKGYKFSTYATWWIKQGITRGISNTGRTIRLPVHAGDTLKRLQTERARFKTKHSRAATIDELAEIMMMEREKVVELLNHAAIPRSLSEPLTQDGDAELGDTVHDVSAVPTDESALISDHRAEVQKMLDKLDERERDILSHRYGIEYGEPMTLEEIGVIYGLTRERIRQIEAKALSKLRHPVTGAQRLN